MATEAETPENISVEKTEEATETIRSQVDKVFHISALEDLHKIKDKLNLPPGTVENSTKAEDSATAQNAIVDPVTEGNFSISDGESFIKSPSQVKVASEEICESSTGYEEKVKSALIKTEAMENESRLQKDQADKSSKESVTGGKKVGDCDEQASAETSLEKATTQINGLSKSSEVSTEQVNLENYMGEKLPSFPVTSVSVDLNQQGKVEGGNSELMVKEKQNHEEHSDAIQVPVENQQKNRIIDHELVEIPESASDEKILESITASQNIEEEKPRTSSQKDEIESKISSEDPDVKCEIEALQVINATVDQDQENASPAPDLIKQSLQIDARSVGETQEMEEPINERMEEVHNKDDIDNNVDIPITETTRLAEKHEDASKDEPYGSTEEENIVEAFESENTRTTILEQEKTVDEERTSRCIPTRDMELEKLKEMGELDSENKLENRSTKEIREECTTEENEASDSYLHNGEESIIQENTDVKDPSIVSLGLETSINSFKENGKEKDNVEEQTPEIKQDDRTYKTHDADDKTSGEEEVNEESKIGDKGENTQKHLAEEDRTVTDLATVSFGQEVNECTKEEKEENETEQVIEELDTGSRDNYNENQNAEKDRVTEIHCTIPKEDENEEKKSKGEAFEVLEVADADKNIAAVIDTPITTIGEAEAVYKVDEVRTSLKEAGEGEVSEKQIKEDVNVKDLPTKSMEEKTVETNSQEHKVPEEIEIFAADKDPAEQSIEFSAPATRSAGGVTIITNSQEDKNETGAHKGELSSEAINSVEGNETVTLKDEDLSYACGFTEIAEETMQKESSEKIGDTSPLVSKVHEEEIKEATSEQAATTTYEFKTASDTKISENTILYELEQECRKAVDVSEGIETGASSTIYEHNNCEKEQVLKSNLRESNKEETKTRHDIGEHGTQKEEVVTFAGLASMEQNLKPVDSIDKIGGTEIASQNKHSENISFSHSLVEETVQGVGGEVCNVESEEKIPDENGAPPEEEEHVVEAIKGNKSTEFTISEQERSLDGATISELIQTSKTECVKVEKMGETDSKEETENVADKENMDKATTDTEQTSKANLHKDEGEDFEDRSIKEDGFTKDHNSVFLRDEIIGQSRHEDENGQKNIDESVPDLKGEDQSLDAEDNTISGIQNEKKVHCETKTTDVGENVENKEVCVVTDISTISDGEEEIEEIPKGDIKESKKVVEEVCKGLETSGTDEHIENQIIHEDGAVKENLTIIVGGETIQENSQKGEPVAIDHVKEVSGDLEVISTSKDSEKIMQKNHAATDKSMVYVGEELGNQLSQEDETKIPQKEVCSELEKTCASEDIDKQMTEEADAVTDNHTVSSKETLEENFKTDEEEAKKLENEFVKTKFTVFQELGEIDTATSGKKTENKIIEDPIFIEPFTASTEAVVKESALVEEEHERLETSEGEVFEKQITQDVGAAQLYTGSLGKEIIKENSREDELYEELNTVGAREDAGNQTLKDGTSTDTHTVSVREQTAEKRCHEGESKAKRQGEVEESRLQSLGEATDFKKEIVPVTLKVDEETIKSPNVFSPIKPGEEITQKEGIENSSHASPVSPESEEQSKEIPEKNDGDSNKHEIVPIALLTEEMSRYDTEPESGKQIDASNFAYGEMIQAPTEAVVSSSQGLDVEDVKLKQTSSFKENVTNEILLPEKSEERDAKEEIYEMPDVATVIVPKSVDQDTETNTGVEISASNSSSEGKSEEKSHTHPISIADNHELQSLKVNEKIEDETPVKDELRGENVETPLVGQIKEEMNMQIEEPGKFEEDFNIESKDIEKEILVSELDPVKLISSESKDVILEKEKTVEVTEFKENSKSEIPEPSLEKMKSDVNDQLDASFNEIDTIGANESMEKDTLQQDHPIKEVEQNLDEKRKECVNVEDTLVEIEAKGHSHNTNTENLTQTLEAIDIGEKLENASELKGRDHSHKPLPQTNKTESAKERETIKDQVVVSVEDQTDGQCFQEEVERENHEKTGIKLDGDVIQDITLVSTGEKTIEDIPLEDEMEANNPHGEISLIAELDANVHEGLEIDFKDETNEKQIAHDDKAVEEQLTVKEEIISKNSQKGEVVEYEAEVSKDLEVISTNKNSEEHINQEADVREETVKQSSLVDEKEAKKPDKEVNKLI